MRKFIVFMMLVISTSVLASSHTTKYKAGVHYDVIPGHKSAQPELREYFSLLCPHCAMLEMHMPKVKEGMPEGMEFTRTHTDFLSGHSQDMQVLLTRAYVAAKQEGRGKEFVDFTFKRIHKDKQPIKTDEDVEKLVVDFGLKAKALKKNVVVIEQTAMQSDQMIMVQQGALSGVPTLVVNGKYVIRMSELDRKDPLGDMARLIKYLSSK